jgi:hypothetical protein
MNKLMAWIRTEIPIEGTNQREEDYGMREVGNGQDLSLDFISSNFLLSHGLPNLHTFPMFYNGWMDGRKVGVMWLLAFLFFELYRPRFACVR